MHKQPNMYLSTVGYLCKYIYIFGLRGRRRRRRQRRVRGRCRRRRNETCSFSNWSSASRFCYCNSTTWSMFVTSVTVSATKPLNLPMNLLLLSLSLSLSSLLCLQPFHALPSNKYFWTLNCDFCLFAPCPSVLQPHLTKLFPSTINFTFHLLLKIKELFCSSYNSNWQISKENTEHFLVPLFWKIKK